MTIDDINFEELEKQLDPGTRIVVALLRKANEELIAINKSQLKQMSNQSEQIEKLTAQIDDLRHMLFGRKSEKMPSMKSEVRRAVEESELFSDEDSTKNKPLNDTATEEEKKAAEEEKKNRRRKRARAKSEPKRKAKCKLKENLPVIRENIEVTANQLPKGYTLEDFRKIGADKNSNIVRRIDHVREHLVVVEYSLQTLASSDNKHIVTAQAPPAVIGGGHYEPGVYADIVVNKCLDSLPLYRIERRYERAGFPISRSTLCTLCQESCLVI